MNVEESKYGGIKTNDVVELYSNEIELPELISRKELAIATIDKVNAFLSSEEGKVMTQRDNLVQQLEKVQEAIDGDIKECTYMVYYIFANAEIPALYDPYLAYQWYGRGFALVNEENYIAFRGMPGSSYQGVKEFFYEQMAEMLIMFGSPEQKVMALSIIKDYIDKYWGKPFLCIDNFIYALLGMAPKKGCRDLGHKISDTPLNLELAKEYYIAIIDQDISEGDHNHARCMMECFEELLGIKYYDQSKSENQSNSTSSSSSGGACYIATCVYGSYDCPQVWTLRRFRDEYLSENAWGRVFIKIYYFVSPWFVKCFGQYSLVRCVWKILLDKWIGYLRNKGVSNSQYED